MARDARGLLLGAGHNRGSRVAGQIDSGVLGLHWRVRGGRRRRVGRWSHVRARRQRRIVRSGRRRVGWWSDIRARGLHRRVRSGLRRRIGWRSDIQARGLHGRIRRGRRCRVDGQFRSGRRCRRRSVDRRGFSGRVDGSLGRGSLGRGSRNRPGAAGRSSRVRPFFLSVCRGMAFGLDSGNGQGAGEERSGDESVTHSEGRRKLWEKKSESE